MLLTSRYNVGEWGYNTLTGKFFRRDSLTKQGVGSNPRVFSRGAPYGWAGSACDAHLFGACLNTMFLFRRRSNENFERDVPRSDVISFGVEPLRRALVQGVFDHDANMFGGGTTRRSLKRSQAAQPPLERRGAKCDLASQMKH